MKIYYIHIFICLNALYTVVTIYETGESAMFKSLNIKYYCISDT